MKNDPGKRREAELQEQWDKENEVFQIQNAAMRNRLLCDARPDLCSACGETTCIKHWKAQNKLWGISEQEAMKQTSAVFPAGSAKKGGSGESSEPNAPNQNFPESKKSNRHGDLASGNRNLFNMEQ